MSTVERTAVVGSRTGLHARPAVQLVKAAKGFSGTVRVGRDGAEPVDAKSLVKVLGLKAKSGETLRLTLDGEGADTAASALAEILALHD